MSVEAMIRPDSNLDHQGYEVIDAPTELHTPERSASAQITTHEPSGYYEANQPAAPEYDVIDALPDEPQGAEPVVDQVLDADQGKAIREGIDVINERLETYVPQTPDEARSFMTGMQAMAAKVQKTDIGYAVFGHEIDPEVAEQFIETAAKGADFWALSKVERTTLNQVLRSGRFGRLTAEQRAEAIVLRTKLAGEAAAEESASATLKRYKEHISARLKLDKALREEKRAVSSDSTDTTEPAKKQADPRQQPTEAVTEPATGRHASTETAPTTATGTGRHVAADSQSSNPDTYGRHMATSSASQAHRNTKATGRHRSGEAPEPNASSPADTQDTIVIPRPDADVAASTEPAPAAGNTAEPAPAPTETRPSDAPKRLWAELSDDHKKAWANWNVAQRQAVLNGYAERQAIRELQTPDTLDPEQRQAFGMASADTKRRMIEAYKDARGLRYYAEAPAEVWSELSDADKARWNSGEWTGHQKQKLVSHSEAARKARGNHLPVPEGVGEATWQRMSLTEKQQFVHNHVRIAYDVLPADLRADVAEASWQGASATTQRRILDAYNVKKRAAASPETSRHIEPVADVTSSGLRARFTRGVERFKQWRESRKAAPHSKELRNRRIALVAAGATVLATAGIISANSDGPAPKAPVAAEQPAAPNANNLQPGLLDDGSITIPQQNGNTQPGLIDDGGANAAPAPQTGGESLIDDGTPAAPAPAEQPAPGPAAAPAPEMLSLNAGAATLWEALHEAGIADADILDRLDTAAQAAQANGAITGYDWRGSGTDRYLEVQLQDGSTTTDTAATLNAIGSYITK